MLNVVAGVCDGRDGAMGIRLGVVEFLGAFCWLWVCKSLHKCLPTGASFTQLYRTRPARPRTYLPSWNARIRYSTRVSGQSPDGRQSYSRTKRANISRN